MDVDVHARLACGFADIDKASVLLKSLSSLYPASEN
jgi:hypothetical protein